MKQLFYFFFLLVFTPSILFGQDSLKGIKSPSSLNKKAQKVEKSLTENNPEALAKSYEELADGLIETGDFVRAEFYINNALELYKKQTNSEKVVQLTRRLAQVQESQQKYKEAITNFRSAGNQAQGASASQMNFNDANRVTQRANPGAQMDYIDANIELAEADAESDEQIQLYRQKAETNLLKDDKEEAIESYGKAIELAAEKPAEAARLKRQVAIIYADDNKLDEAIAITENALEQAISGGEIDEILSQKLQLADLYFKNNQEENAISLLEETYTQAVQFGKTYVAKETTINHAAIFESKGNTQQSLKLHDRFLEDFETLIMRDSSLVDTKLFTSTEEKILQLEKERQLKDALLEKSNTFNLVLVFSVLAMLVLLAWIARSLYSIQKKNKRIALQSLRREMNPHFIFNSLNSVNQFIAQNNELEANKYLTSYSNLMRSMMETSNEDFITLNDELEQLKKYLDLEHLRFQDKFEYEISVDETLDPDAVKIPGMLIQPQLENAIWHGLRYKEEKGFLKLHFLQEGNHIKVIIEDNGIGLEKSKAIKTGNQKLHISRGLNNVRERIELLNDLYKQNIQFKIENLKESSGTRVTLTFN
ncbi:MAG: histidine kinase [Flavobacteriaceae bacterium]|nr:histidine kinase [Flavobacteriaceae bacterium]